MNNNKISNGLSNNNITTGVEFINNEIKTIPSYEVSKLMEKEHWEVLRMLEGYEPKEESKSRRVVGIIPILNDHNVGVVDYYIESTYVDAKGENRKCYECTKMGCEMLANKLTGEKGILFSAKYVKAFNDMEKQLPVLNEKQQCILNIYEGGIEAVTSAKRLSEIEVAEATVPLLETIEEQSQDIDRMVPKEKYFDNLVERNLLINFRDTAKELGIKERQFINWLLSNKYIYRDNKKRLMPYAQYSESGNGLFAIKEYCSKHTGVQTLITPKGRETFRLLLEAEGLI